MALHKKTTLYCRVTPTNNIRWQNSTSTMRHILAIKVPNFG